MQAEEAAPVQAEEAASAGPAAEPGHVEVPSAPLDDGFAGLPLPWVGGLVLALFVGGFAGAALARRRSPPRLETTVAAAALEAEAPLADPAPAEPAPADPAPTEPAPSEPVPAEPFPSKPTPTVLERMRSGLARTSSAFGRRLASAFGRGAVDEQLFEELEEALLTADVGVRTTTRLLDGLRGEVVRDGLEDPGVLRERLAASMLRLFTDQERDLASGGEGEPTVILVVGVNGSGKTTTIGKLAARYKSSGERVLMGAGDTFRAGAIEQLRVWSERAGADFVAHQEGADPAAVLFDALEAAKARGASVVLCDTAGRLQSKKPLMEELAKVHRVVGRAVPQAPHEVLLVLDATMGQNALSQARTFGEVTGVTGVVLTKLDGTAKGGIVLAITAELGLPVKFVGIGEQVDDLRPFEPGAFVEALLEAPQATV